LHKDNERISIKDCGMKVIDALRSVFKQMPQEMNLFTEKVFNSLDVQEKKLNDPSLTPSGKIIEELQNNNKTWEELNLELAKKHSTSLRKIETDLDYLSAEAENSLKKFKELEEIQEENFDIYLDKFVNDI